MKYGPKLPDPRDFSIEEMEEVLQELEKEKREIEQSPCGLCEYPIRRPWRRLHSSDYKTMDRVFFHTDCYKQYLTWRKKWIMMWAEIGWHARVDILILWLSGSYTVILELIKNSEVP